MDYNIDLADIRYAEAIYSFCSDNDMLTNQDKEIIERENLSFLEFVMIYKYKEFCIWLKAQN